MYPKILVDLAKAGEEGADVAPMLHDALIECGYPYIAEWCFGNITVTICKPTKDTCYCIAILLGDPPRKHPDLNSWEAQCKHDILQMRD